MKNIKAIGGHYVADGGIAFRLRCVAYPEASAHGADAILVSATSLTLKLDGVADSTVGASGVLAFATYTTLGALVDAINLSDNWEAEIVGNIRSATVNGSELLARTTSTFRMYQEVDIYCDSSDNGNNGIIVALEPNKPFETVHGTLATKTFKQNRVSISRIRALINTSDSSAWSLQILEVGPDRASVLRTLYSASPADNTEKDTGQTDVDLVQADWGNMLAISASSSAWADSGAYVDFQGTLEQSV